MKFLYVLPRYDYFKKGRNGSVTHAEGIVSGLSQNEVDVSVLSGPRSKDFMPDNITVLLDEKRGRFRWFFLFLFQLIRTSMQHQGDIIVVRFSTKYGLLISFLFWLFKVKNWGFELNSFNYCSIKQSLFRVIVKKYEYYILSKALFINTVSDALTQEAKQVNINTFTLPNAGPFDSKILDRVSCNKKRDVKTLNIVYMGAIRDYFDLPTLVRVVSKIDGVKLHVFGKIGLLSSVKEEDFSAENTCYHGEYQLSNVFQHPVFESDFYFALPYKSGSVAEIGSPTKLFEYLSIGVPIISTRVGQPYKILQEAESEVKGIAYFYDDSNEDELIELLIKLKFDKPGLARGKLLEFYNSKHTWKVRCGEYLTKIKKVMEN